MTNITTAAVGPREEDPHIHHMTESTVRPRAWPSL